jgi:hypothetical protein
MSVKSKVAAVAATLTMVGGVGMAGLFTAGTASAATPSCGPSCIDIFSKQFGEHGTPNDVVDVLRQGKKVGQPIILFRTANFDPAEDWSVAFQGDVSDFFAAGLVTSAVALHYGCEAASFENFNDCFVPASGHGKTFVPASGVFPNDPAFEIEYAPYGVDSGYCMGVSSTAFNDEGVTLQPCGVSSKTVWILDSIDVVFGLSFRDAYVPLINGSDTNFSQPFVLTYPNNGEPTDMPRPQLTVQNLQGSVEWSLGGEGGIEDGTVNDNQLWGADIGTLNEG